MASKSLFETTGSGCVVEGVLWTSRVGTQTVLVREVGVPESRRAASVALRRPVLAALLLGLREWTRTVVVERLSQWPRLTWFETAEDGGVRLVQGPVTAAGEIQSRAVQAVEVASAAELVTCLDGALAALPEADALAVEMFTSDAAVPREVAKRLATTRARRRSRARTGRGTADGGGGEGRDLLGEIEALLRSGEGKTFEGVRGTLRVRRQDALRAMREGERTGRLRWEAREGKRWWFAAHGTVTP